MTQVVLVGDSILIDGKRTFLIHLWDNRWCVFDANHAPLATFSTKDEAVRIALAAAKKLAEIYD